MSIEDNKQIAHEFWRRFSASDFDAAVDLLADDNFSGRDCATRQR